jgi:hypothetical protein
MCEFQTRFPLPCNIGLLQSYRHVVYKLSVSLFQKLCCLYWNALQDSMRKCLLVSHELSLRMLHYFVGSQQGSRIYGVQLLKLLASWSMYDVIHDMRHFKHVNIIINCRPTWILHNLRHNTSLKPMKITNKMHNID